VRVYGEVRDDAEGEDVNETVKRYEGTDGDYLTRGTMYVRASEYDTLLRSHRELEHDINRHLAIAAEQEARISNLERELNEQARVNGAKIADLERRLKEAERDAKWGAHNGGAHQLLKLQHATSVELYNALRALSPNHAVVIKHYELSPEALSGTGNACAAMGKETG
jgi:hypothetical protein